MSTYYNPSYFNSSIFDVDYAPIAEAIIGQYHPKTIIEFGCGNGELSKALAKQDSQITITAIDGYATPDFTGFNQIEFSKIDLNDPGSVKNFLSSLNKKFDVAICMEVAEHLNPDVSEPLIDCMTSAADVVVFSAAVPQQDGDGHINCRTRGFWHKQFERNNFFLRDTIRSKIRHNPRVGKWYALNTVDYQKSNGQPSIEEYQTLVANLIDAESEASSSFYMANRRVDHKQRILNLDIIKGVYIVRNVFKKCIGKPGIPIDIE